MTSGLKITNLSKIFDNKVEAVKNVNIETNKDEFLVLVGPSGCGKTTILRMIAGLETNDEGSIELYGKDISKLQPKDRNIGMVFQNYALYPHLTVFENIAFPLKIAKIDNVNIKKRVEEVADIVNLNDFLDRKPAKLSGGQRQRTALARALVRKPDIFLFDEPLSNLDAGLRRQMRSEITRIHRLNGVVSVYVTHDQIEAMTMGTKIAVINNGEILQTDTPQNIYNNPIDIFTAQFIGTPQINIFPKSKLQIDSHSLNSNHYITLSDGQRVYAENENIEQYVNQTISYGIRPENLFLTKNEKSYEIKGRISNIEYLGYEHIIFVETANSTIRLRTQEANNFLIGNNIELFYDPKHIIIFNKDDKNIHFNK